MNFEMEISMSFLKDFKDRQSEKEDEPASDFV